MVVGLTLLAVHVLGGHAHADPLVSVPLAGHIAGDGHHEDGGACVSVQGVTSMAAAEVVLDSEATPETSTSSHSGWLDRPPTIPRPPRFLLHASFLN